MSFFGGAKLIELLKEEMHCIAPLCQCRKEDVVLWSCVEGNMGRIWVNKRNNPTFAMALVADFCFLLGSENDIEEDIIVKKLSENSMGKVIVIDDILFGSMIEKKFPNNFKRFNRYALKGELKLFQKKQLEEFILIVESEFEIKKIDESIYYKVLEEGWTADFCSNFISLEDYLKNGIGYVIMHNGEIISGAGSYSYCEGKIEITIGTKEEYRRKGLALACASKLILDCLERNVYPRWDAVNKYSVALAEKLGYDFEKEYVVYSI